MATISSTNLTSFNRPNLRMMLRLPRQGIRFPGTNVNSHQNLIIKVCVAILLATNGLLLSSSSVTAQDYFDSSGPALSSFAGASSIPSWQQTQTDAAANGQSSGSSGSGNDGGSGGGDSTADATNPTAPIAVFQLQNTFMPSTYEAAGFGNLLAVQVVLPFKTRSKFFPNWITRTTLPIAFTADPDAEIPIGPGNDNDFTLPLDNQQGLGDTVFISIFNHPTEWGSWGVGPGFVAPTATRAELGEQSWKFSPTFAVVNTKIKTWQLGVLGVYNFPLDSDGTQSLQFQPLIVKQLKNGWYTGWGDDLWTFNTESGNFAMPLQLRLGKVRKIQGRTYNVFATGFYTPDSFRKGPAPEWGIKISFSRLFPESK
jgi:hypothetical protein